MMNKTHQELSKVPGSWGLGTKSSVFPEVSENYVTAKVTAKRVKRFSDVFVPTDTLIMQRVMIGPKDCNMALSLFYRPLKARGTLFTSKSVPVTQQACRFITLTPP